MSDDDSTRALPEGPRTSPIPLRKQPAPPDHGDLRGGRPSAQSGVVVPSSGATQPGCYPQQGYPQQGPVPREHPPQGYPNQAPAPYPPAGGGYTEPQYPQPIAYGPPPTYGPAYGSTTMITRPAPNGALVAVAWIIAVLTFFYMLPWAIAATRGKSNQAAVGLINFLLGWSFIGWVVALVMACTAEPRPSVMIQHHYGPGYHR